MILNAHAVNTDTAGVLRLQYALNALGKKKNDHALLVDSDGVVGPATVRATTRALGMYVVQGSGVIPQSWIRGTSTSIIKASANDIARFIEQAAGSDAARVAAAAGAAAADASARTSAAAATRASMLPSSGGSTMFPQQQAYYPQQQPGYYPQPPRGPGGLPTNQASLDVKAFIPAQYDHIQLHPAGAMAIVAVGVLLAMVVSQHRAARKP